MRFTVFVKNGEKMLCRTKLEALQLRQEMQYFGFRGVMIKGRR